MELNALTILQIFEKNFPFPIVHTVLGDAVQMDAVSAFLFSNITGAGYFNGSAYPFSPRGTQKILREAFQFHPVTGILDNDHFLYSPRALQQTMPTLFYGDKYILLRECQDEWQFAQTLQNDEAVLRYHGLSPTDFLFLRIEAWKRGNGMECFLEYLACEYFRRQGYIVESQIPLTHAVGTPDFGGYKRKGTETGFYLNELSMLKITGQTQWLRCLEIDHVIVGEAKTSTTHMTGQLEKYLQTSLFQKGYEMHPARSTPAKENFGLLHIGEDFSVQVTEPLTSCATSENASPCLAEYLAWYQNYLKFFLLANFSDEELYQFVQSEIPSGKFCQKKMIKAVVQVPMEKLIAQIREVL